MKKLLIITQKIDENDQLLGFSVNWFRHFAEKFDVITILCLEKGRFDLPENVKVISLGKDRGVSKLGQLFNFYKNIWSLRGKHDAVFVFMNAIWIVLGSFPWLLLKKNFFLWYAHKTITWKHRLAEKLADGIFTSTPEGFRIRSRKVMVVGQGIDTDMFRPDMAKKPSRLSILSVGRIAPIKNYEVLLRAAKTLHDKGTDFHITIIGEPVFPKDFEYEKRLKNIVAEMDLKDKVNFVGKVVHKDLPSYYQSSHIFVNLGKTGSLDKTIVEAMACGANVISSNDAAVKFLPKELVVSGDDPQELADKIEEISTKHFGGQLREFVIKNHSLKNLVERISSRVTKGRPKILIAGYPYARDNYLKTFDGYKDEVVFVLPGKWKAKGGKVVFSPPNRENIIRTKTFFFHSNYPLIGGLLKGFMPVFPWHLFRNRMEIKLVYSATEPILLTTLYQGFWAKFMGKKHVIFTWENVSYDVKFKGVNKVAKQIVLWLNFKLCDGLICGNHKALEIHKKYGKPMAVIPLSGVDDEKFRPMSLPKRTTFLFAGALDIRKGINLLLDAFEKTADNIESARLLVVGSGTYEEEFKKSISVSRHKEKITVIPWVENEKLPEFFNTSKIFVYPSISYGGWEEQFGYSMAEASLCELPVIATSSGSIEEVVLNEKTGILVSDNNAEELKGAMVKLAGDMNLREEMGRAGREYIVESFSYSVIAEKFYKFLNGI